MFTRNSRYTEVLYKRMLTLRLFGTALATNGPKFHCRQYVQRLSKSIMTEEILPFSQNMR